MPYLQVTLEVALILIIWHFVQVLRQVLSCCTYRSVLNGRFCQKQMPAYNTVCRKPSAALSDTLSCAWGLAD